MGGREGQDGGGGGQGPTRLWMAHSLKELCEFSYFQTLKLIR